MEQEQDIELLVETSPNGNITAIVEQDDRVVHIYLHGEPDIDFGVKSCWVRNLQQAPDELDEDGMGDGIAPMLPAKYCTHPEGLSALDADRLSLVWFEEGDAAALLEDGDLLAVIPAWGGMKGFHGYARDCIGQSPLCWRLGTPEENAIFDRVGGAAEFWRSWEEEPWPWEALQDAMMSTYEAVAPHTNYYAIDNDKWPPTAMIRVPVEESVFFATLGVSIRPQPNVEGDTDEPELYRRIELAVGLAATDITDDEDRIARCLSAQAARPWSTLSWLGHGHTICTDAMPDNATGPPWTAVLLLADPPGAPVTELPGYRDDPVTLLWMVPITEPERDYAMEHGSEALCDILWRAGVNWRVCSRPEVPLAAMGPAGQIHKRGNRT